MLENSTIKPIIILPPDTMSDEHIQALRDNNICVVVAAEPARVKFLDPIPSQVGRTKVEDAAIMLSRKILNPGFWSSESTRDTVARTYVDILMKGTPLDPRPPKEEVEKEIFDHAKADEIRRLARLEAQEERAAAKAAKAASKK